MKSKLMISYSRRQTPFVDRLYEHLQKAGYPVWLDYHDLVPSRPWYPQVMDGIKGADTLLLVVSKDSIESKNVTPEWTGALDKKKRIILLIFEAFPLPDKLKDCEWVDFRVNYKASLKKLHEMLAAPKQTPASPAPQSGFKAPALFWLTLALSVIVLVGSVPAWWTIYIPYVLIPLPRQIYNRNYSYSRVIPVLLLYLPLFLPVTLTLFSGSNGFVEGASRFIETVAVMVSITPLFGWIVLGLLRSEGMQRRAQPEAARVRFANPEKVTVTKPEPVVFTIDNAPEDERYAYRLRRKLESYGHRLAETGETPKAVFVLISAYKNGTSYNPDDYELYPIILQKVSNTQDNLRRIQWIDFRRGLRNVDILARLLPEPQKLVKALAAAPTGTQEVFPGIINSLMNLYLICGILGGGGILLSIFPLLNLVFQGVIPPAVTWRFFFLVIQGLVLFGAVLLTVRGLRLRKGGTAALYPLIVLTLFQGLMYLMNSFVSNLDVTTIGIKAESLTADLDIMVMNVSFGPNIAVIIFAIGLLINLLYLFFRWFEFTNWLPRHPNEAVFKPKNSMPSYNRLFQWIFAIASRFRWRLLVRWLRRYADDIVSKVEETFLLYTPQRGWVLVFHLVFHFLFFGILAISTVIFIAVQDDPAIKTIVVFVAAIPTVAVMMGARWLSRRLSK